MKKIVVISLVNFVLISLVFLGEFIDSRFLDLYQFTMWFFILISVFALFLPSKDLFKDGDNSLNVMNWTFSLVKVGLSVWAGMPVLAACYLVANLLCYIKKQSYFEGLKVEL